MEMTCSIIRAMNRFILDIEARRSLSLVRVMFIKHFPTQQSIAHTRTNRAQSAAQHKHNNNNLTFTIIGLSEIIHHKHITVCHPNYI